MCYILYNPQQTKAVVEARQGKALVRCKWFFIVNVLFAMQKKKEIAPRSQVALFQSTLIN